MLKFYQLYFTINKLANLFFFVFSSTPTTPRERDFLPTIEVGRPGEHGVEEDPYSWRKNEYYRSMTSLVLERSNKNSHSWVSVFNCIHYHNLTSLALHSLSIIVGICVTYIIIAHTIVHII